MDDQVPAWVVRIEKKLDKVIDTLGGHGEKLVDHEARLRFLEGQSARKLTIWTTVIASGAAVFATIIEPMIH